MCAGEQGRRRFDAEAVALVTAAATQGRMTPDDPNAAFYRAGVARKP